MSESYRKKLIEVALPLERISAASRREKDKKSGTIRNVHKWFAPMPLPAWRALLFATLVDDPGEDEARHALLRLVEELVPEDGGTPTASVLAEAKALITRSTGGDLPVVLDPFCGGGSTLVEAQRLGLETVGSDLNPVPVLITRVLTELVPQMAGEGPVGASDVVPGAGGALDGFLADLRHYAEKVRERVWQEIGHLYPRPDGGGRVVAWLWARTASCPNPACGAAAPLVSSFWLSKKKGRHAWIEPIVLPDRSGVMFEVCVGSGSAPEPTKIGRGGNFRCAVCGETIPESHLKAEGVARRLGVQLMSVAVDGPKGRVYLDQGHAPLQPDVERPDDVPDVELADETRALWCKLYGVTTQADFFTSRQLVTLNAFADAVADVAAWVEGDGGERPYGHAVASVLGLCVGKLAMANSTQSRWRQRNVESKVEPAFSRHALPMVWDFAEANPFGGSVGDWMRQIEAVTRALRTLPLGARGHVVQRDARAASTLLTSPGLVATDPPYFGQIGYADLSDFFYVWHRRALRSIDPDLYATIATSKEPELIEAPHRHGGDRAAAKRAFVEGFTETFRSLQSVSKEGLPLLVIYAHRSEETGDGEVVSTGWDAMLTAVINAGLSIVGTWPIHATGSSRQIGIGTNALASYVVLVCRPRVVTAPVTTRRAFVDALRGELPEALRALQHGGIAPVDLAQAAIGPGMAVFSRYAKVIEADGAQMRVRTALGLINRALDEVLAQQDGDFDAYTRFAVEWFQLRAFAEGPYGEAELLATAKGTAVGAVEQAGILVAHGGKARLLGRMELDPNWDPLTDSRLTVWEIMQHLIKRLEEDGESAAAELLRRVGGYGESARELAYRLFSICDRKGWAQEALGYNALGASWTEIQRLATHTSLASEQQSIEV